MKFSMVAIFIVVGFITLFEQTCWACNEDGHTCIFTLKCCTGCSCELDVNYGMNGVPSATLICTPTKDNKAGECPDLEARQRMRERIEKGKRVLHKVADFVTNLGQSKQKANEEMKQPLLGASSSQDE